MSSGTPQLGQPFSAPVAQTVLPVVIKHEYNHFKNGYMASVEIIGFFPILETEFDGTETFFTLSSGDVDIKSLKMPDIAQQHGDHQPAVREYMVAVYEETDRRLRPWLGHPSFVPIAESGYYSRWSLPTVTRTHSHGKGVLVGSLWTGMDVFSYTPDPGPTPPVPDDATLRWAAELDLSTAAAQCAFFDFNWIDLFKAKPPAYEGQLVPLTITPSTQPSGGEFKATVLQRQTILPGGAPIFNTVRIIRMLDNVQADDYEFNFDIKMSSGNGSIITVPVELTLTVVYN